MALSSGFCNIHGFPEMVYPRRAFMPQRSINWDQRTNSALKHLSIESFSQRVIQSKAKPGNVWSFIGGSKLSMRQMLPEQKLALNRRHHGGCMMSEIASTAFTIGTVAVLPFYTLMVVAPKSELTKKAMKSSIPYVALGIVYAYLLYLSWTPETMQFMFASKYWLPELPGIARMFSNEMTLASAWIHLLAVDLFAARQVFRDGLENKIETRHSVSLCLLFCPVGIFTHFITKALAERRRN